MKLTKEKLQKSEREVRDLVDVLDARAHANDHHPNFPKAKAYRQSSVFVHEAANNLFMAIQAMEQVND